MARWTGSTIGRVKNSPFARNFSYSSARSLVGFLAQLLFTPIIAKLYGPEAYGGFGVLMGASALLMPLFTWQYERALLMASTEEDIQGLRALCNTLPVYMALLTLLVLLIWAEPILRYTSASVLGPGIYLLPLLTLLGTWMQVSQQMVAVRQRYKESFFYGSGTILLTRLFTVAYGLWLGAGFMGLTISELLNRGLQRIVNVRLILKEKGRFHLGLLRITDHLAIMRKFSGFPRYELPAVAVAAIAHQVPLLWLPRAFGLAAFGQFTLAVGLLEVPMRVFGYSLSGVFYQRAAIVHREHGMAALRSLTLRTVGSLFAVSALPLLAIVLFSESVFAYVFGAEWALAGAMAAALSIGYFARLLVEPIGSVLRVIGEQKSYFLFHGNFLLLRVLAIGVAMLVQADVYSAVMLFSLANAVGYTILGLYIFLRLYKHD